MAGGKRKRDSIHETPDVSYITNPDVAHEHTDVPVTPVLKFIAGLVVFAIVMHLAMYAAFIFFEAREEAAERQSSPLARTPQESLPPEPRLQLAPGFEVKTEDGPGHRPLLSGREGGRAARAAVRILDGAERVEAEAGELHLGRPAGGRRPPPHRRGHPPLRRAAEGRRRGAADRARSGRAAARPFARRARRAHARAFEFGPHDGTEAPVGSGQ